MDYYRGRYRIASARLPAWDYTAPGLYFVTICVRDRARLLAHVQSGQSILSAAGRVVAAEWCRTAEVRSGVTLDVWVVMPDHLHGTIRLHRLAGDAVRQPGALGAWDVRDAADTGGTVNGADGAHRVVPVGAPDRRRDAPPGRLYHPASPHPASPHPASGHPASGHPASGHPASGHSVSGHPASPDPASPDPASARPTADALAIDAVVRPGMPKRPSPHSPSMLAAGSLGAIVGQFKAACTRRLRAEGQQWPGWQPRFWDVIVRDADTLRRIRRYIADNPVQWERSGRRR